MNKQHNSRKRKIYSDYSGYSADRLLEIVKKQDEYDPVVIRIIKEILEERNVIVPQPERANRDAEVKLSERAMEEENERQTRYEKFNSFVSDLKEKPENTLSEIIVRYSSYQFEKVEAALYVSVEKGLIQYDLKELLLAQIKQNIDESWNPRKKKNWERNNAFLGYVSRYSDEEIYSLIEDPSDIVIDVYHAILVTARERELISEEELHGIYERARAGINRKELSRYDEFYGAPGTDPAEVFRDVNTPEADKPAFWNCPICGEKVDNESDICRNCQADKPVDNPHKEREEMIRKRSAYVYEGPVKAGLQIMLAGAGIIGLTILRRSHWDSIHLDYIGIGLGALFVLGGMVAAIYGLFTKSGK